MKTGEEYANTDYLSGFQYRSSYTSAQGDQSEATLQYFPHAEGYVQHVDGEFFYIYNYTDHLGNIRLSYTFDYASGLIKIMEENHYYPFGLKHDSYNTNRLGYSSYIDEEEISHIVLGDMPKFVGDGSYNYKYNGKELQDELGLNFYDYGARNYDPALGRWMNIDLLAEKYFTNSPYVYAGNIPTLFVDYDGNDFGISFKDGAITITQKWYHDGKTETKDLLNQAIAYLNDLSGKYGIQTEDGTIIPINFSIEMSTEDGKRVEKDGLIGFDSQTKAMNDDMANFMAGAGMELVNSERAIGMTKEGGDYTRICTDCDPYGPENFNADSGYTAHEIMHSLGMSHEAIGKYGKEMTKDGIGGMLQYASKNSKGFKVKLNGIQSNSYLKVKKSDKPKVVNTSPEKVKLNGTIIEIK